MPEKKILSVVIARANSKGLEGKNFKILCGRPLIQWSILASLRSRYPNLTVVSSNCDNVKDAYDELRDELGEEGTANLKWIQRPQELSTPTSKNEEVIIHAYYYCKDNFNFDADVIIHLQPTSPIRNDNLIDKCFDCYYDYDYDSLVTVTRMTPFMWQNRSGEWVCPNDYYIDRPMRQKIPECEFLMHDNGSVYITDVDILLEENNRLGGKVGCYETDEWQSLQIDTELDFKVIENIAKERSII